MPPSSISDVSKHRLGQRGLLSHNGDMSLGTHSSTDDEPCQACHSAA
jgi:hypothetical protein